MSYQYAPVFSALRVTAQPPAYEAAMAPMSLAGSDPQQIDPDHFTLTLGGPIIFYLMNYGSIDYCNGWWTYNGSGSLVYRPAVNNNPGRNALGGFEVTHDVFAPTNYYSQRGSGGILVWTLSRKAAGQWQISVYTRIASGSGFPGSAAAAVWYWDQTTPAEDPRGAYSRSGVDAEELSGQVAHLAQTAGDPTALSGAVPDLTIS